MPSGTGGALRVSPACRPARAFLHGIPGVNAGVISMFPNQELSFFIGKFLVSPSARVTDAGDFAPSVSIRRGHGTHTHDKVFRFTRRFASHRSAVIYAIREGRSLVVATSA